MQIFQTLLARIATALEERGIPYMVIGGQAVLIYGELRATKDIDITLGVDVDSLARVLDAGKSAGLGIREVDPESFVRKTNVAPFEEPQSHIRVDFIFSFTPYERQAIERARAFPVGGAEVKFATVEDLIVHKMVAGRPRDVDDVKGILNMRHPLDRTYLEKWLPTFKDAVGGRDLLREFTDIEKTVN